MKTDEETQALEQNTNDQSSKMQEKERKIDEEKAKLHAKNMKRIADSK